MNQTIVAVALQNRSILLVVLFLMSLSAIAQKTTSTLSFTAKGLSAGDTVYLANYFGPRLYYNDTAISNANAEFTFRKKERPDGKYAVVMPDSKLFEIILADGEDVVMRTDTSNIINAMQVVESKNNQELYRYITYLNDKRIERDSLAAKAQRVAQGSPDAGLLQERMNALNRDVMAWQYKFAEENSDLFVGTEIKQSIDVPVPDSLTRDAASRKGYFYYVKHYWDNTNFKDGRIVRSPVFGRKLENYITKTLVQDPDTIFNRMLPVIEQTRGQEELFKYVVHYTTYTFESSKVMGMDRGFVRMVDEFYRTGQATWLDSTQLADVIERADKLKPLLIGERCPVLSLPDSNMTWYNIYKNVPAEYTVLYFFDPDCGHCKKETPKLVDFYNTTGKSAGVKVVTVCANNDEKWREYLVKTKMDELINLAIPSEVFNDKAYATELVLSGKTDLGSLNYHDTFDVYATPKVFLLDKDKKIIAKHIAVEQIGGFIERYSESKP